MADTPEKPIWREMGLKDNEYQLKDRLGREPNETERAVLRGACLSTARTSTQSQDIAYQRRRCWSAPRERRRGR